MMFYAEVTNYIEFHLYAVTVKKKKIFRSNNVALRANVSPMREKLSYLIERNLNS